MTPPTLAEVRGIADPLERARAAGTRIGGIDRERAELCRIRDDAIRALAGKGMTSPEITDALAPDTSLGTVKAARSARRTP